MLEGRLGLQLGDTILEAGAGTWVVKPRQQWHTFWNADDVPCRTIEIVSPAGFEKYFSEVAGVAGNIEGLTEINARYGIEMDFASVASLCERFGLMFPPA